MAEIIRKLGLVEMRRLNQLDEENRKQLVAGLSLDKKMLQDVVQGKVCRCGESVSDAIGPDRSASSGPKRLALTKVGVWISWPISSFRSNGFRC